MLRKIVSMLILVGCVPLLTSALGQPNPTRAFMARFVDALPIPPTIRVGANDPEDLNIQLTAVAAKLHRDLPETPMWGYNQSSPGPTIEVESGKLLRVHWQSRLPTTHVLAAPAGMMMGPGGTAMPDVRSVTHLHGAVVSQPSTTDKLHNNDGWPDAWIVPGEEQIAEYPNQQSARILWYHDHASGETGRNVAAGLAGMYLIHDDYERSLNLPSGQYDIPLMIRSVGLNANGTLYYTPNVTTEFYGNAITVNGKLWPYLEVEPRKYRFRIVNASNARSYELKLLNFSNQQEAGPAFYQVASDSGFLENTAVLNDPAQPNSPRLTLAPAERADIVVDFAQFAGKQLLLHNSNKGEDADGQLQIPQVMVFRVGTQVSAPGGKDPSSLPLKMQPIAKIAPSKAALTRRIVIGHVDMANGDPMLQLNGASWTDPITEKPALGTTEIWEIINTEPDTHPFHVHLVSFQVLDRTPFDAEAYLKDGTVKLTGSSQAPDPNESGWKDTVRVRPGEITRIIMNFGPYTGYYVYHCHILEHEDMDMMRPFQVVQP